jgi:hypothetical protein
MFFACHHKRNYLMQGTQTRMARNYQKFLCLEHAKENVLRNIPLLKMKVLKLILNTRHVYTHYTVSIQR